MARKKREITWTVERRYKKHYTPQVCLLAIIRRHILLADQTA